jgi:hypothetical protein
MLVVKQTVLVALILEVLLLLLRVLQQLQVVLLLQVLLLMLQIMPDACPPLIGSGLWQR